MPENETPLPRLLLTRGEVAKALGLSVSSVMRAERTGRLVPVRYGRAVRFHVDAVNEFAKTLGSAA